MSNRSDRRAQMRGQSNVTRIDRDKPDLSGVDMASLAVRYILTTVTVPDALGPEQVTDGMIDTLNTETRKSPPWLKMHSEQVYPGLDVIGRMGGNPLEFIIEELVTLSDEEVDEVIERVRTEQARREALTLDEAAAEGQS